VTVVIVLPWNDCFSVTMTFLSGFFDEPYLRASLNMPSFASAPELQKNTVSNPVTSVSLSASSTEGSVMK
jgi:hypothetical protein